MALDPQVKVLVDQMAAAGLPPFHQQTPEQARAAMRAMIEAMGPGEPVAKVENRTIPGASGEMPARIFHPAAKPNGVLVYFHGGGWVIGDLTVYDPLCRALTNASGCVTLAIEYRLAPEHRFPAAAEDCYAALKWASQNAAALGSDPDHVVVAGDSAGGNLAAVVSLMARDRRGPGIRFQALIYPVTDAAMDTPSHREFTADGMVLSHAEMVWFWGHYLKDQADGANPYASPMRAHDLRGLPPAIVITAEYDPLRDEGEQYAQLLEQAGTRVKLHRYAGVVHGFVSLAAAIDQGKVAIRELGDEIKAALR